MLTTRLLARDEVEKVWSIDRREVIDHIYYFEDGGLVLKPEYYDMTGWPPRDREKETPLLLAAFDRGGWFCGCFDGEELVGVAVLDNKPLGKNKDRLQLSFLHVSRDYRRLGIGKQLFEMARAEALARGAGRLYVSATPSENTVQFYQRRGCVLAREPNPELFALEPEDIHLECDSTS